MTLDNLLGKSLEAISPDAGAIRRLLDAAQRNIADARIEGLSNENRFDMAYKAIILNSSINPLQPVNKVELAQEVEDFSVWSR